MWSSEDEAGEGDSSESDTDSRPMNTIASIGSSNSDNEESSETGEASPVNLVLRMRYARWHDGLGFLFFYRGFFLLGM